MDNARHKETYEENNENIWQQTTRQIQENKMAPSTETTTSIMLEIYRKFSHTKLILLPLDLKSLTTSLKTFEKI